MSRLGGVSPGVWFFALRRSVCCWRRVCAGRVGRGGGGLIRRLAGEEFGVHEFDADSESVVTVEDMRMPRRTGFGQWCEVSDRCGELRILRRTRIRCASPRIRSRPVTALRAVVIVAWLLALNTAASPASAVAPESFRSADGIRVLSVHRLDARLVALTLASDALPGPADRRDGQWRGRRARGALRGVESTRF